MFNILCTKLTVAANANSISNLGITLYKIVYVSFLIWIIRNLMVLSL